jgi:hypothetical protein
MLCCINDCLTAFSLDEQLGLDIHVGPPTEPSRRAQEKSLAVLRTIPLLAKLITN